MAPDYPEEILLRNNQDIIDRVLKQGITLRVSKFSLEEDFENDLSRVFFILNYQHRKTNKNLEIESRGSGVVDALFSGIIDHFSKTYVSLQNVFLYDFLVDVKFKESQSTLQTDAPVEVKIALQGSSAAKNKLYFKAKSNSLVKSGIGAVCNAVEYLINAELAVVQLHKDIKLADKRKRLDLSNIYVNQLSELVKVVSYSKVINKLNKR
tara:strand:+ start:3430 stop:4056 length:627 start_codon:yes stop_codon:yes gene_type:complete